MECGFSNDEYEVRRRIRTARFFPSQLFFLFVYEVKVLMRPFVRLGKEVADALAQKKPVVALESTLISHGMPYPQNVETGKMLENVIRSHGATPATIGIFSGEITVGLSEEQLECLGKQGPSFHKTSRRDISLVVGKKMNGATTVSATMIIANMVGIPVFATGGIGGVHRGGEDSMDVSADLTELGKTPTAVVCAGVKFILDIPRTLEYLETMGVTVLGYQTDTFPAFYLRESGVPSPARANSAEEIAEMMFVNRKLALGSGMVIGVPVPAEHAAEPAQIHQAVDQALQEADKENVKGKNITPFLLKRVAELSGGESLKANIELVKNNAIVASQIAVALSRMENSSAKL